MSSQPRLHDGALIRSLDTKGQVGFLGWPNTVHIATHHCREELTLSMTPL